MKRWINANRGFVAFLLLFGVFRTAVADWNPIPSGSMRPGLLEGDVVFVNRLAFDLKVPLTDISLARLGEPRRGDVVTFFSPQERTRTIKRIMALPGDVVEMRGEQLAINGAPAMYAPLDTVREDVGGGRTASAQRYEEMVMGRSARIQVMPELSARRDFKAVVPADHYLMLGDNRDNSADSRYFGMVPRSHLIGRAERILVSADILDSWAPRTERFGMSLR